MSQDSEASEVHHNIFLGPTAIGGPQHVVGFTSALASSRPSVPSQVWAAAVAAWAFCPLAAWWTRSPLVEALFSRFTGLAHAVTLYVLLVGGVALLLDGVGFVLYRHWAMARRAITHPITWKVRLSAVACGGIALAMVVFMTKA